MGRVKYTARRKKKAANPPSNQLAPRTEDPSINPQPVSIAPPEIQPKAHPRDVLWPAVEWKGKQKLPEYPEPILESSDENVMPSGEAFDLYSNPNATAPASRRHPGESSSDPSKKRAWTEDPPAPTHSKDMTPPPAPVDLTPPAPRNPRTPAQSGMT
ncbi:predicted GPI-anchored protein 58 [Humulus lupulus]|uniref:predicted GPI-anchored protein 58 n=1 Tax=Humulus lupulus TaxID=3486 RepID=UPI002B4055B0|nr:predicted GPI-anchored protein 58 [Humulus lupulus]